MNGASILMIIVLAVALMGGMVFLVGELNRSAEEILVNRQTIQDLQAELEQARLIEARQQQSIDALGAALDGKTADLDQALQALQASQAEGAALKRDLEAEKAARAGFEQQAASLSDRLRAAQDQVASLAAENARLAEIASRATAQPTVQPQIPVTGPTSSSGLPLAASAAGLAFAGGGVALVRRLAR